MDPSGHQPSCVKDAATKYEKEGLGKEEAYRKAYAEHAREKLNEGELPAQERIKLERRAERLGMEVEPSKNRPEPPKAEMPDVRILGEGDSEAYKKVNGYEAKVNKGQQNKHISHTNEYKNSVSNGDTRSTMNGDLENIQKLLDENAGTGSMIGNNKERVDFGKVIGQYVDPTTGNGTDTTIG